MYDSRALAPHFISKKQETYFIKLPVLVVHLHLCDFREHSFNGERLIIGFPKAGLIDRFETIPAPPMRSAGFRVPALLSGWVVRL